MNEISREELQSYEQLYRVDHSIGDLTPTVCALHGLTPPETCGGVEIASVVDQAQRLMDGMGKNEKTLIFCPDAVGEVHRRRFPDLLKRVENLAGFRILSSSVMPSVTPVCFSTIFTGASPKVHGIQKYEKPVLQIPTLFDVFAGAGKNVAIIAVNSCSIDTVFRNRKVDYYSTRNDAISFSIARRLIEDGQYDLIVCYFYNYDHMSHKTGPWSAESVGQLELAVSYFEQLTGDVDRCWKSRNRTVVWAPDHGNHVIDEQTGGHGENIPDDMVVNHFSRVRAAGM